MIGTPLPRPDGTVYLRTRFDGEWHYVHRLIWLYVHGYFPIEIDHEDHTGTNNRLRNLRECTGTLNLGNRRKFKHNTSGYKGVYWRADRGYWVARIQHQGKGYHLGIFDDPAKAHEAYLKKARELFGEFARAA
jgi:HNH endonuclease/AP2 domain